MGDMAAFAALAGAGVCWGTGFVFGKVALEELAVGHMLLYRFVFAAVGFLPIVLHELHTGHAGIRWRDLPMFALTGIIGIPVQFVLQFEGLARTTAAVFTGERLSAKGWLALAVSGVGTALIASAGHARSGERAASVVGDALVLISLVACVAWMLMTKRLLTTHRDAGPAFVSAYSTLIGTWALMVFVLATKGPPPAHMSGRSWLAVSGLGLVSTLLATLLWNWGLTRVSASKAGVFVNLEPVVGGLLGIVLFHDQVTLLAVGAGACVIGASVAVTRAPAA
jgi:drug/metabolite transporter (DMT)-like permease